MIAAIRGALGLARGAVGAAFGGGGVWILVGGLAVSGFFALQWARSAVELSQCREQQTRAVADVLEQFGEDQAELGEIARRLRDDLTTTRETVRNAQISISATALSSDDCDLDPISNELRRYFDSLNRDAAGDQ